MTSVVHYSALLGIPAPHKQVGRTANSFLPVCSQTGHKAATNRQGETPASHFHVPEGAGGSYIVLILLILSGVEIYDKGDQ